MMRPHQLSWDHRIGTEEAFLLKRELCACAEPTLQPKWKLRMPAKKVNWRNYSASIFASGLSWLLLDKQKNRRECSRRFFCFSGLSN
jgi:hypothetical protein